MKALTDKHPTLATPPSPHQPTRMYNFFVPCHSNERGHPRIRVNLRCSRGGAGGGPGPAPPARAGQRAGP